MTFLICHRNVTKLFAVCYQLYMRNNQTKNTLNFMINILLIMESYSPSLYYYY